jgi:tRNA 5-methylaminomethyl-2-thiouridine biosynthesis bifunctional protein
LSHPAWFYPGGGAIDPAAYARAMLTASGAQLRLGTAIAALRETSDGWQVLGADGQVIDTAPLLVLAGGHVQHALLGELAAELTAELTVQRGQLTHLPDAPWAPRLPVAGDGYAIADGRGGAWCGATAQDGDIDAALRDTDQADNLTRYARLAGLAAVPQAPLAGRVGWRLLAPDRLPLIGGLAAPGPLAPQLRMQPRRPGLIVCTAFGSRGITWAALAGQLVAALALGLPRPLESELLDAVDPQRFALRRQRRPAG